MARAFLIVLDSAGCGGAPDAEAFGDAGANTLAHIAQACARGDAEQGRSGPLHLPNMDGMGLGAAIRLASGDATPGLDAVPRGAWAAATELSQGKDTPSGHWELAGVPVPWDWHYFPQATPAFPADLVAEVCTAAGTDNILGNCHASGTVIINDLGDEHIRSGWPICYTSADSVFQIAAHEDSFGLDRLYALCRALAPTLHEMKVGRVIARPFVGCPEGGFTRTANRKDFAIAPPSPTLCDWVQAAQGSVHAIGKIGDIFSMRGIDDVTKGDDAALFQHLVDAAGRAAPGSLTFANFVEFDSLYGHRRDVSGYARALEWFDQSLPRFLGRLRPGDLAILTADHGNDPTWRGTDHTRERVPVLVHGADLGEVGLINFADVAATLAHHLGLSERGAGRSFL
ncbi:phosphopentomutase [Anianabacter salinae]|uniref:phosphopentomutase n=1 Tax=Anianabacter salinae TaxID=2851023 RepID=UPI00225E3780|nr:phosphopentomutase [Anianabacter salinae]MBV0911343.1 phosphopentomutase [Anianabacter salinae]